MVIGYQTGKTPSPVGRAVAVAVASAINAQADGNLEIFVRMNLIASYCKKGAQLTCGDPRSRSRTNPKRERGTSNQPEAYARDQ